MTSAMKVRGSEKSIREVGSKPAQVMFLRADSKGVPMCDGGGVFGTVAEAVRFALDTSAGLLASGELPEPEKAGEFLLGQTAIVWQGGRPIVLVHFADAGDDLPRPSVLDLVAGADRTAEFVLSETTERATAPESTSANRSRKGEPLADDLDPQRIVHLMRHWPVEALRGVRDGVAKLIGDRSATVSLRTRKPR